MLSGYHCLTDAASLCLPSGVALLVARYIIAHILPLISRLSPLLKLLTRLADGLVCGTLHGLHEVVATLSQEQQCVHFKALAAAAITLADLSAKRVKEVSFLCVRLPCMLKHVKDLFRGNNVVLRSLTIADGYQVESYLVKDLKLIRSG